MAKQVQLRRGTTAELSSVTGAEGEVIVDTTKDTLTLHDAYTAGGIPMLREDLDNLAAASVGIDKISISGGSANKALKINSAGTGLEYGTGGGLIQVRSYRKTSGWSSGNNGPGRVEVAPFDGSAVITPTSSTSLIAAYVHIVVKHGTTWRSGFIKVQGNSGSGWFDFGTATSSTYNEGTHVSGNDYAGMFFIPNQGNTNPHYVRIFNEPHDNGYNHRLGSTIDTSLDDSSNRSVFGTAAVLTLFEYAGDIASLTTIS